MAMQFCVIGSGSSGNCSVLRTAGGLVLIDAGFGPRRVAQHLKLHGHSLADVQAILLTHFDHDHFKSSWARSMALHEITLYCHDSHIHRLRMRLGETMSNGDLSGFMMSGRVQAFEALRFTLPLQHDRIMHVQPIALPHDELGTYGFRIEHGGTRLGFATDLGNVPEPLIQQMRNVDLLALESNYDPQLQELSGRPRFLIDRVMGGFGHLSNEQALEAVMRIAEHSTEVPRGFVMLHLSRECNRAQLIQQLWATHSPWADRLHVSSQQHATPWFDLQHASRIMSSTPAPQIRIENLQGFASRPGRA